MPSHPHVKPVAQLAEAVAVNEKTRAAVEVAAVEVAAVIPILLRDGVALHPQPTSDPLDPLNWSPLRKHTILAIIMALYLMFTWITTVTVPSFPALGEAYGLSSEQLNWTVGVPSLGLAVGPLLVSSLADSVGRRIVLVGGTLIALAATIAAALAPTYSGYMAARFFQGLGVSPASSVGLAVINDMFFSHQRGQKTGLWVLSVDLGLLVGPLVGGFVVVQGQQWVQWVTAIILAVILVLELLLLPETLYPRNRMLVRMPYTEEHSGTHVEVGQVQRRRGEAREVELARTDVLPWLNVRPLPGMQHPKALDTLVRFGVCCCYAAIAVPNVAYAFTWYWWLVGLITMIPAAYADYSAQAQGLLTIGLIVGFVAAEVLCSGTLSDWIMRRRRGRTPEQRLWLLYPAALVNGVGLAVWGLSIDRQWHWAVGQAAFVLVGLGSQMGGTLVAAYVCDAYPLQSMAVIVVYAVMINLSAFVSPFFIAPWVASSGYTWTFAAQGLFTFAGAVLWVGALHVAGGHTRARQGLPPWVNPEFDALAAAGATAA